MTNPCSRFWWRKEVRQTWHKRSFCFLEPLNLQKPGILVFVSPSWWFLNIGIHRKLSDSSQKQDFFVKSPQKLQPSNWIKILNIYQPINKTFTQTVGLAYIETPDPTKKRQRLKPVVSLDKKGLLLKFTFLDEGVRPGLLLMDGPRPIVINGVKYVGAP